MPDHVKEKQFEDDVEEALLADGGYVRSGGIDVVTALDSDAFVGFAKASQPDKWAKLVTRNGGDEERAAERLVARLAAALDTQGPLAVLRGDFTCENVKFKAFFPRPAFSLDGVLAGLYEQNVVSVARQVRFDPKTNETLDLVLLVNGIPVATAELKLDLTGQRVESAADQYRKDRDRPGNTLLHKRALIHFAVDQSNVKMTTKLDGQKTVFLPFDRGSNPGAMSCGAGNAAVEGDYATSYLWLEVWQRDNWLELLQHFFVIVTEEKAGRTTKTTIFPRYHQWSAVREALDAVRRDGPGSSYLFQHSAGSGKSNTIGWTADRLALLHDEAENPVFSKVIVVTDRRVLDEQLRRNVTQFGRPAGWVATVVEGKGSKSQQLLEALRSASKIVTVTLESFPHLIGKLTEDDEFNTGRYAVIADEAHSSQTGEAARALKEALGAGVEVDSDDPDFDASSALGAILASRGRQPNMSFFAYTATPKPRTLKMFGTPGPDQVARPFHLYSMRQAIEEGFILDVLANYTTYDTFWNIATKTEATAGEEHDRRDISKAIFQVLKKDPDLIRDKAEIIVEYVRTKTMKQLGGRAQAMVVTDSRASAVRVKQAIDAYIGARGYSDIAALVAFSGSITDDDGIEQTEAGMNGFPDSQTKARFLGEGDYEPGTYQVMVVAEKFQTGFDDPLLTTMFVLKPLSDLHAVQTLSRLNRAYRKDGVEKTDVYVIDFVNTVESIRTAFEPYFESRGVNEVDGDLLSDIARRVEDTGLLDNDEIVAASNSWFGATAEVRELKVIQPLMKKLVDRFDASDEQTQRIFREESQSFCRTYSFVSHILPYTDERLERLYVYLKAALKLTDRGPTQGVDLSDEFVLTHLRLERNYATAIGLAEGERDPEDIFVSPSTGQARQIELFEVRTVVEELNARFGTEFDETDVRNVDAYVEAVAGGDGFEDLVRDNSAEAIVETEWQTRGIKMFEEMRGRNEDLAARAEKDAEFFEAFVKYLLGIAVSRTQERLAAG